MNLQIGDKVKVINDINAHFLTPDGLDLDFILESGKILEIDLIDFENEIINGFQIGTNGLGATMSFSETDKLEKI